jgi:hypothetical protein
VRHLTPAETDRDLQLIAAFKEFNTIPDFIFKIMIVRNGTELHLFDANDLLLLARIFHPLFFFKTELPVVHYFAYGRLRHGRDLHEVIPHILRPLQGGGSLKHTVLFPLRPYETNLGNTDHGIDSSVLRAFICHLAALYPL